MSYTEFDVEQGSEEWHALRARYPLTASSAPVMMGDSPHKSREALLREMATGEKEAISSHTQKIFDKGHAVEELARPLAERDIFFGEKLPNVVAVREVSDLNLLASFDGLCDGIVWEHKQWNAFKASKMAADDKLLPEYEWQLEHQMLVAGKLHGWFHMSDGTTENEYVKMYQSDLSKREALIAGWKQFLSDLAEWRPSPSKNVIPASVADLPELKVDFSASLVTNAKEVVDSIKLIISKQNKELCTDEDFAEAEAFVKAATKAEKQIEAKIKDMLSQLEEIELLQDGKERLRQARLASSKQVRTRKDEIRYSMIDVARSEWEAHKIKAEAELGCLLAVTTPDFGEAAKGKKTFDTMQDALNTKVAREKVELTNIKERAMANAQLIPDGLVLDDVAHIISKEPEDFDARCQMIIAERKEQAERLAQVKPKVKPKQAQPEPKKADPLVQELMDLVAATDGAVMNEIAASVVATFIMSRRAAA